MRVQATPREINAFLSFIINTTNYRRFEPRLIKSMGHSYLTKRDSFPFNHYESDIISKVTNIRCRIVDDNSRVLLAKLRFIVLIGQFGSTRVWESILLSLSPVVSRGTSRGTSSYRLARIATINKAVNDKSETLPDRSYVLRCPRNRGASRNQVSHSPSTTSSPPLHTRAGRDEIMMYARFLRSSKRALKLRECISVSRRVYEGEKERESE